MGIDQHTCYSDARLAKKIIRNSIIYRKGEVWKKIRSAAAKQVVPRRVANFVEPLSIVAEELLSHLESIQDESGVVQDITPELSKWAFHGKYMLMQFKLYVLSVATP